MNEIDKTIKTIQVGNFYLIHDGSKSGHPGYVLWLNNEFNLYLLAKFGTTPNEHNIHFPHPVGKNIEHSYLYKKLFLGKRRDLGKKQFTDMKIQQKDVNFILKNTNLSEPTESKSINRKDRRRYKKTLFQGQLSDQMVLHDIYKVIKSHKNVKQKVLNK